MTFQAVYCLPLILAVSTPALAQDAEAGAALYERHCAMCHGADATGQGPLASSLTLQPTDLTQLRAENGGSFPRFRVVSRIDGRDPLVSHGSPMPVYGEYFEGEAATMKEENGQPILTTGPIADLVEWLVRLQK